ncbi:hypothetical protein PENTCL1PPCAC_3863, partial [Pristionchus entomophagus]
RELGKRMKICVFPMLGHENHGCEGAKRHQDYSLRLFYSSCKFLFELLCVLALRSDSANIDDLRECGTSEVVQLVRVDHHKLKPALQDRRGRGSHCRSACGTRRSPYRLSF